MFKNSKLQSYLLIYLITFVFFTFFKIFKIDLMIEHIAEIIFMILTLIIICRIDNPFNPEKIKQYSKIDKPKLTKILIISTFVIFILITYGLTINGRYIKKTLDILPISQRLFYFFLFFISGFFEEILIKFPHVDGDQHQLALVGSDCTLAQDALIHVDVVVDGVEG